MGDLHKSNAGKETKIGLSHLNNHGLKEKWHNAQRRISRSLLSINRTKTTEHPSVSHSRTEIFVSTICIPYKEFSMSLWIHF
jgi:hypothetical protein